MSVSNPLLMQVRQIVYRRERRKGRQTNMIWLLTKLLKWSVVDVTADAIGRAGGRTYAPTDRVSMDLVFETNDRGIKTMKDWCSEQCGAWRYEPSGTFMFRSRKDAALFKLRWF